MPAPHVAPIVTGMAQTADLRERLSTGPARRLALDGVDTHVVEVGTGPPLVLLHGGIESGGAYWAPVLPRLAASHRLIVPDVPGLGESAPLDTVTQDGLDNWFRALLRATCAEPPVLYAHSSRGHVRGPLRRPEQRPAASPGALRRPGRRALPDAARSPVRRGADGRPAVGAQSHAVRPLAVPRPDADPRTGPGLVRPVLRLHAGVCPYAAHPEHTMRRLISLYTKQIPLTDLRAVTVPTALLWG